MDQCLDAEATILVYPTNAMQCNQQNAPYQFSRVVMYVCTFSLFSIPLCRKWYGMEWNGNKQNIICTTDKAQMICINVCCWIRFQNNQNAERRWILLSQPFRFVPLNRVSPYWMDYYSCVEYSNQHCEPTKVTSLTED